MEAAKRLVRRVKELTLAVFQMDLQYFDTRFPSLFITGMRIVFWTLSIFLRMRAKISPRRAVLYVGHCYYYPWYLSRGVREFGWRADVLNWDSNPASQIYYHGEDYKFEYESEGHVYQHLKFYICAMLRYDIFHFSNAHAIAFGFALQHWFKTKFGDFFEIYLLKKSGKKIVYSHNACLDGASQTAFSKWGPESVCSICIWRTVPTVCSDQRNLDWGRFRNSVADYQCTLGGNRVDFNNDARVHEQPEFYCQSSQFWSPEIEIPLAFQIARKTAGTLLLYHGVGNKEDRTSELGVNIHTSHIYYPIVDRLKGEGLPIEILSPTGIPNKEVRFIQAQSDIFLDMLTYGWFGAMAREAMMLGKPVICYIRPAWLESVREQIPAYADELPIVSATPETIERILRELILDPERRRLIGEQSRAFAVKWHSTAAGGRRFNEIYGRLLSGDPLLIKTTMSSRDHARA